MKFLGLLLLALVVGSCFSDGDCLISATNYMHLQFKKRTNVGLDTTLYFTHIYVSGTDSIIFKNDTLVSDILLPVDIQSNSTTFVLQYTSLSDPSRFTFDTLQVGYTTQSKVIAKDCGAFTYYQNLKILKTNLKEAQIKTFSTALIKDPTSTVISAYAVNYQLLY
jgi:hypothetical protein